MFIIVSGSSYIIKMRITVTAKIDGVGKVKKGSRIGIGIIWGIMVLMGMYILWFGGTKLLVEWKVQLNQRLQEQTERTLMPSLTYMQKGEKRSLSEWITANAMQMIPLGGYVEGKGIYESEIEDEETYRMILAKQANEENEVGEDGNLVNGSNEQAAMEAQQANASTLDMSIERLRDFDYLITNFYTVDSTTMIDAAQLNVDDLLGRTMKINPEANGPKVLIFHTHSQETFADSAPGDPGTSIVGVGAHLAQKLNDLGIPTLHHQGVYDLINGQLDRSSAYEYAEAGVRQILAEHPSIEVVIDLHRDGVNPDTHLVTEIAGKQCAKIMYFNGLSRTRANGDIAYLANPYIQDNLSFSLQMQLASERMYPGFVRRIYLSGYRYSLHMMPKSLLIEAGAQTNTVGEMMNAMDHLAGVLKTVLTE